MKYIPFFAIALLTLSCNTKPEVKINYLEPMLSIGEENRIEAEVTMDQPIDEIVILLKANKNVGYIVNESEIEYSSNRKKGIFSTKLFLPEETQRGKDTIIIGAQDINNNKVDGRWQIWIAYPDSRFKKYTDIDE